MITNEGRKHAGKALASAAPSFGQTIAFGIGTKSVEATDKALDFEIFRAPVTYSAYDPLNDRIILRTRIPSDFPATITEVGVYASNDIWQDIPQQTLLYRLGQDFGIWAGGHTWSEEPGRSGFPNMIHTGTNESTMDKQLDMSAFFDDDQIVLLVNASGTTSIGLRFAQDASNYFEWTFTPQSGYKAYRTHRGALTAIGNPEWSKISRIRLSSTGGTTEFDALTVVPQTITEAPGTLLSRSTTQMVINPNQPQDIEIYIGVSL